MRLDKNDQTLQFTSRRTHRGYSSAQFHATFQITSQPLEARPGSLLYWMTEGYALWVTKSRFKVYKGTILHKNWTLQKAEAHILINQLVDFLPSSFFRINPIIYFSKTLQAKIFPFERKG